MLYANKIPSLNGQPLNHCARNLPSSSSSSSDFCLIAAHSFRGYLSPEIWTWRRQASRLAGRAATGISDVSGVRWEGEGSIPVWGFEFTRQFNWVQELTQILMPRVFRSMQNVYLTTALLFSILRLFSCALPSWWTNDDRSLSRR